MLKNRFVFFVLTKSNGYWKWKFHENFKILEKVEIFGENIFGKILVAELGSGIIRIQQAMNPAPNANLEELRRFLNSLATKSV